MISRPAMIAAAGAAEQSGEVLKKFAMTPRTWSSVFF
jgi:hypothetical protein